MAGSRILLLLLFISVTTGVLSRRSKSQSLRQFNAGHDASYGAKGGVDSGLAAKSQECVKPGARAIGNAKTRCVHSGCRVGCKRGYSIYGSRSVHLTCDSSTGQMVYNGQPWQVSLPQCNPTCAGGCPGGECIAPNKCQAAIQEFVFDCNPPCQNGGTCIFVDVCDCPQGYAGLLCQEHRCAIPETPSHASVGGDNELTMMDVECREGYEMKSGLLSQRFNCHHGQWLTADRKTFGEMDVNCYETQKYVKG